MTDTLEPLVTYEFSDGGRCIGARIQDGWSDSLEVQYLGFHLVSEFLRQRTIAQAVSTHGWADNPAPLPESVRAQLSEDTRALLADVTTMLQEVLEAEAPAEATSEVSDPHRRFVIQMFGSQPGGVEVDTVWVRQADLGAVEAALVEALQAVADHDQSDQLGQLRARHAGLMAVLTDMRRG